MGCNIAASARFLSSQSPCVGSPAADPKKIGDSGKEHKGRKAHSDSGDHGIIAGKPDKVGISHVIDHKDDLPHNRGNRQPDNSFYHRRVFKQVFL